MGGELIFVCYSYWPRSFLEQSPTSGAPRSPYMWVHCHFYAFWAASHPNKNLSRGKWQEPGKKKKLSRIICSYRVFMINFKQILWGRTNWCHLAKVAGDFSWRGWGISSLRSGSRVVDVSLRPREHSPTYPWKKQALLRCHLQLNPLPSQWVLEIQCPFLNELVCLGRCH